MLRLSIEATPPSVSSFPAKDVVFISPSIRASLVFPLEVLVDARRWTWKRASANESDFMLIWFTVHYFILSWGHRFRSHLCEKGVVKSRRLLHHQDWLCWGVFKLAQNKFSVCDAENTPRHVVNTDSGQCAVCATVNQKIKPCPWSLVPTTLQVSASKK